eukprot:TRINITY_DN68693_c0_g1_i1.p1 TRINITY_DN68693_c0_g1~~TRINITY_DN68693_c0_g1_i1.p1  ORF type:complete len:159 (+),score=41.60 TRINITY_DN68693_c0_g1_i1:52-528(+)
MRGGGVCYDAGLLFAVLGCVVHLAAGCIETQSDSVDFCYRNTDDGVPHRCRCPWTSCQVPHLNLDDFSDDDSGNASMSGFQCITTQKAMFLYAFFWCMVALFLLIVSWIFCCRGPGLTCTQPFKGGILFGSPLALEGAQRYERHRESYGTLSGNAVQY